MSPVVYADSSALVKLVVRETESSALRQHLHGQAVVSSALARTEVMRAVMPHGEAAAIAARGVVNAVELIRIADNVLDAAGALKPAGMRSLDAIHLATAALLGDDLSQIITYDLRMAEAARAMGLHVVSPQ